MRRTELKKRPTDKNIREKNFFSINEKTTLWFVCRPTDFKSPPMLRQLVEDCAHRNAQTPNIKVKVGAADLSQLAIQYRKVVSVRVVGVALVIEFEEAEGETEVALKAAAGAAAEAHVAGSGC
jgi:hypothetical protein